MGSRSFDGWPPQAHSPSTKTARFHARSARAARSSAVTSPCSWWSRPAATRQRRKLILRFAKFCWCRSTAEFARSEPSGSSATTAKRFDSEDLRIALVLTRFAGAAADMGRLVRGLRHENDRFLATLSHEMRTPLGTARLAARALQRSSRIGDPSIERQVEIIDRQTTQLLALVDDITDFESIRAGRLRLRFTRVSAQEVVSRALEACGGQIATKKHRVEVAVPQEPVLLTADQVRLTQILINLIGNAVKYTPTGGELKISVEHSKSEVSFRIGDSGIGIDPEFRPHVFDMFVQAPMRNRPRDGGLGLGLALVRDLAELHGGVVTVESAGKGLGAAFTVTLPRAGTQREGPAGTPSRVRSAAKPGSRDQSI